MSTKKDVIARGLRTFLGRIAVRSRLNDAEQQAILDLPAEVSEIRTNRDLVSLGEVVDRTCLVADGLIGRFGQTRDGKRLITALHIPGDMPDLHSFVVPRASEALTAVATSTVLRISHKDIDAITRRHPPIAKAFWRDGVVDAEVACEWMLNIGRRSARGRVAHLLCEMALRYEQIGRFVGLQFTLPLNQNHMADALGLTSVHVNRTLGGLRRANIVGITGTTVQIQDWSALVTAADFDPGYLHFDNAVGHTGKTAVLAGL